MLLTGLYASPPPRRSHRETAPAGAAESQLYCKERSHFSWPGGRRGPPWRGSVVPARQGMGHGTHQLAEGRVQFRGELLAKVGGQAGGEDIAQELEEKGRL